MRARRDIEGLLHKRTSRSIILDIVVTKQRGAMRAPVDERPLPYLHETVSRRSISSTSQAQRRIVIKQEQDANPCESEAASSACVLSLSTGRVTRCL